MKQVAYTILGMVWLLQVSSQTNWKQLGNNNFNPTVWTLYHDTSTHILYAGGTFLQFGGLTNAQNIAKWDGTKWDTLAGGISGSYIKKIIKYKNYIYVLGDIYQAGNLACRGIARWDGTQWDTLCGGADNGLFDADVYNDTLYVCGAFSTIGNSTIGNVATNFAAKFDGTTWYPMSFPFTNDGPILRIRALKDKVYATGAWYANGFSLTAKYSQQTGWQPGLGVQGNQYKGVFGMERIDTLLYYYGRFTHLSTVYSPDIAAWSGTKIYDCGFGINPNPNHSSVSAVKKINNKIYCVGQLDNANGLTNSASANLGIASLEGNQWCIYGDDFDNVITDVTDYNDTLVIGGAYKLINGNSNIAVSKWVGGSYTYACNNFYTGLQESDFSTELKLFPNPTNSILNIYDDSINLSSLATIEIINYLGQTIISIPFSNQIDISNLSSGMYYLTIQDNSHKKTVKIIK